MMKKALTIATALIASVASMQVAYSQNNAPSSLETTPFVDARTEDGNFKLETLLKSDSIPKSRKDALKAADKDGDGLLTREEIRTARPFAQQGAQGQFRRQQGAPEQSKGQQGEPKQFKGQQGRPRQFKGQQGEPKQFKEQQGGPKQFKGQQGGPRQFKGQQGEPKQFKGQQGGPRQLKGQQGEPKQFKGQQGKPRQFKGQQGEPRQFKGQQGEPKQFKGQQGGPRQFKGQQGGPRQFKGQQGGPEQFKGQQGTPKEYNCQRPDTRSTAFPFSQRFNNPFGEAFKDGKVELAKLPKNTPQPMKNHFENADKDKDGFVTLEEIRNTAPNLADRHFPKIEKPDFISNNGEILLEKVIEGLKSTDKNSDGKIDEKEKEQIHQFMEDNPFQRMMIRSYFGQALPQQGNHLLSQAFVDGKLLLKKLPENMTEESKEAYKAADKDADGSLTLDELKNVDKSKRFFSNETKPDFVDDDKAIVIDSLKETLKTVDANNDGAISREEFTEFFKDGKNRNIVLALNSIIGFGRATPFDTINQGRDVNSGKNPPNLKQRTPNHPFNPPVPKRGNKQMKEKRGYNS